MQCVVDKLQKTLAVFTVVRGQSVNFPLAVIQLPPVTPGYPLTEE